MYRAAKLLFSRWHCSWVKNFLNNLAVISHWVKIVLIAESESTLIFLYISLQQPRASSAAGSGYFTNILTQEVDDDLELLRQQDATPSTGGKSKRGSNYTNLEDIQLCKSWIHISNDPIIGNQQPGKTYWERIANDFHRNRDFESDRTPNSLEHRFGIILKECMKFQGYYEEVERRHPSGIPYKEHVIGSSHTLSLLYILTLLYI